MFVLLTIMRCVFTSLLHLGFSTLKEKRHPYRVILLAYCMFVYYHAFSQKHLKCYDINTELKFNP